MTASRAKIVPAFVIFAAFVSGSASAVELKSTKLPDLYVEILARAVPEALRLQADDGTYRRSERDRSGDQHMTYPIALMYRYKHPLNPYYGDKRLLTSALKGGLKQAAEAPIEQRHFQSFTESYRHLEKEIPNKDKTLWQRAMEESADFYVERIARSMDREEFTSAYLGTGTNHFAIYCAGVYRAGQLLGRQDYIDLAGRALQRLCREQPADGYFVEFSGPVHSYAYLTLQAVGSYYEFSKDPLALEACRRALNFFPSFIYPDGSKVETIDERNSYDPGVSLWGNFALTHFPEGRRFAEFLIQQEIKDAPDRPFLMSFEMLGRLAQDLDFWHEGARAPVPRDTERYTRRLSDPAGARKEGAWFSSISGVISPYIENQFHLDRMTNLSLRHEKTGRIIDGSNNKYNPKLATFHCERSNGTIIYLPSASWLSMQEKRDILQMNYAAAYGPVFGVELATEAVDQNNFLIAAQARWGIEGIMWPDIYRVTLQLCFHPSEEIKTGGGATRTLGEEYFELGDADLGGWIEHHGWRITVPKGSTLRWPVLPFNNYGYLSRSGLGAARAMLTTELEGLERSAEYKVTVR